MTFTSTLHPDEITIPSRPVTTWRDAGHPVISYTTARLYIGDGGALTERRVPDVKRHCAGQQCDILFHTPRRLHGHNIDTVATTPVWQLTSNPAAFSVQRVILITVCRHARLFWRGNVGVGGVLSLNHTVENSPIKKRNGSFCRSSELSELSEDENIEVAPFKL